ncbi:hypothetical protein HORIV_14880 [Vreelandella olivaria]|uniref:Uncharacterized protein n=1 Tax=Vreelandella olivaria TaxID=390919 RepID=A0ABM9SD09_9GAMM|nr:hypothetical protein HORIV_14880 [Halomonas olivaria]
MRDLAETARLNDPTRLVAAACLINHAKLKIEDRLVDHLDVIGINEYYGWYDENFDDLYAIGKNSDPDRPVVISETGRMAITRLKARLKACSAKSIWRMFIGGRSIRCKN